jgi:hypothetical protein
MERWPDGTRKSTHTSFTWNDGEPSIFATDRTARGVKGGKSYTQVASEAVARKTKRTGKNPGTIAGLSKAADAVLADRFGGVYLKAHAPRAPERVKA